MSNETTADMACPIPTPAEARLYAILDDAKSTMWAKIQEAALEASRSVASEYTSVAGTEAPPAEFYLAVAHQYIFCHLCEADYETLSGGKPDVAEAIIRNCTGIAANWGTSAQET